MKFPVVGSYSSRAQESARISQSSRLQKTLLRGILATVLAVLCFRAIGQRDLSSRPAGSSRSTQLAEAQSALARGDANSAIAILSNYIQGHPREVPPRLALGRAYVSAGRNDEAQAEFQNVLKQAPDNVPALASAGDIYLHEGELEKAALMLGRAVKADGNAKGIRIEWAIVLARLHKYAAAESALGNVTPPKTNEELMRFHRLKASIASGLGNSHLAAAEMERALAVQPHDAGLVLATATAQLQSRNWQRAANLSGPLFERAHEPEAGLILVQSQLG
ncbi:MAG: tetratricopeptide repeat protein, partial [Acidobacteria bacterium]|nr:tetratricopeptide repeat protein [Acidobacteriota bacterium]